MDRIEEKIYKELLKERDYISTKVLASRLELGSDRALRSTGDSPGLLDKACRYVYDRYGKVIVVRMSSPSGVKLSNDVDEIKSAREQWSNHHWKIAERVSLYDYCLKGMCVKKANVNQMELYAE